MTGFNSKRQMSQDKLNDDDDTQVYAGRKRGSIALARSLCYQINGAADDSDDMDGGGYGSVDIAEILSAEVLRLQKALAQPEQEPVAWKLVPRDPTDEMLKAMDECSTEGYDERLYAGHAASVYMAAWDEAPTPPQPEQAAHNIKEQP